MRLLRVIAGDHGCLVRLEDRHWADADSMALLTYVASALGSCRVASTRPTSATVVTSRSAW